MQAARGATKKRVDRLEGSADR